MNLPYLGRGGGWLGQCVEPEVWNGSWQGCALIFGVWASIMNSKLYILCVLWICLRVGNCVCALRICLSGITSLVPNTRFKSRSLIFSAFPWCGEIQKCFSANLPEIWVGENRMNRFPLERLWFSAVMCQQQYIPLNSLLIYIIK